MSNLQGGLPADPYNPERGPMAISISNPPCVPQFPAPGFMQDLIPVIAGAVALDLQNNAQTSPPRMFVYNLVSRNGYQNELFAGLVMGVVDWSLLGLADGKFQAPDAAAQALLPKMCEMFVANQIMQYQELQSQVPPNLQGHVQGLVQMWGNIGNEVNAFKNSTVYAQMMQGNQGGGGGVWQQQRPNNQWGNQQPAQQWGSGGGQQRWAAGGNQGGGGWVHQQRGAQVQQRQFSALNANAPSGLFAGSNHQDGGRESGSFNTSRFDQRPGDNPAPGKKTAWVVPAEQKNAEPAVQVETVEILENKPEHIDSTQLKWKASAKQPYSLAYNPRTHLLYLQRLADGTVIQLVKERTDSPMDREKHRLPTAFGNVPKYVDTSKSVEALKRVATGLKGLSEVSGDGLPGEEPPKKPLVQVVEDVWVLETSESLAWLQGTLKCMSVMKNVDVPDVYRIRAQIAEPHVTGADETGGIQAFAEAKLYSELREMMKSVDGSMTSGLYSAINRKLTDMINRVLCQELSIGDIRIGSFVDDIDDVAPAIEKFYGETFRAAFLGNQSRNIKAAFATIVGDDSEATLTDMLHNDREYAEDGKPKITYLVSNYTLTYLNLAAVELEMELDRTNKIASMITSDMPELSELALSIFESTNGEDDNFERHLIRTFDDHVLEVTRGLIGTDIFLIKKIR